MTPRLLVRNGAKSKLLQKEKCELVFGDVEDDGCDDFVDDGDDADDFDGDEVLLHLCLSYSSTCELRATNNRTK